MKTLKGKILITVLAGLLVTLALALAGVLPRGPYYAAAQAGPNRSDACFMSQKFVRQNLKAPSTAEFPVWTEANCRVIQTGRIWKVRSYVDAQNSFGAMIRSDYGVEMVYDASHDNWILMDIAIFSP